MLVNFKINYKPAILIPENRLSALDLHTLQRKYAGIAPVRVFEGDSHRLPTAAAWVQPLVRPCVICGGQSDNGTGLHRVHRFPSQILIPSTVSLSLILPSSKVCILDMGSVVKHQTKKKTTVLQHVILR